METRREFLKKAALLAGATAFESVFPESILRALAIDPKKGSTFLDAEHIVILMQENRSFDHTYGTLQGVRGFNDPRAFRLPNQNPVWLQTDGDGETFAPFRLNIKQTNATWMGSLPHSWTNQVDARNHGRYDQWLNVKASGHKPYSKMPLTLGFYTREDIPFYYAFADAFTVCDQHFCSSLTGTTPNRLYLWSGTIREQQNAASPALVLNEEADFDDEVKWTTYPERLEDAGVSWKVYQNEVTIDTGFRGEEDSWLSNFGDNPLEYFTQYRVRFTPAHRAHLQKRAKSLEQELESLEKQLSPDLSAQDKAALDQQIAKKRSDLKAMQAECEKWSQENYEKLSARDKRLHEKAFCVNSGDPHYRELTTLTYQEGQTEREVKVPKGDVFHQFRKDVESGKLPTVSWLVAPENFSDHPSSAWYGAWYVSEALDILTQNPEVWKKTIFILTYDENDGYFDHVPPFVAPHPRKPETGKVSPGIDASIDFVELEQDLKRRSAASARESSIGLGYRVPMVIASPWSRGGCVCSEVFDHTSVLQFLEVFLQHKTGKPLQEPNMSQWRRTVCGDLTSAFQPYHGQKISAPPFPERDAFIESIHRARENKLPSNYRALNDQEIEQIKREPSESAWMPAQEPGTRRSCPLPYQLYAQGALNAERTELVLKLEARKEAFGKRAAGSPFNVYAYHPSGRFQARAYAVAAGTSLTDAWNLADFDEGNYHVRVDGPNGFLREFKGAAEDPQIELFVDYAMEDKLPSGKLTLRIVNHSDQRCTAVIKHYAYTKATSKKAIPANGKATITLETAKSEGWYDFSLLLEGFDSFERRCAGHVETGKWSRTDPAMGHEKDV